MSAKLQQVQRNYRLRNHFGMPVTSLILKPLNGINVNSEYCVKRNKLSFLLEIYSLQGSFVQELRLEIFRR